MMARDNELDALRHALTDRAEDVARALLGPENRRASSRRELRWRSKGSLALALRGRRRGLWHDHEALTGGDLLALIRREINADFAGAVAWARAFLGWPTDGPVPATSLPTSLPADHDGPDAEELARIEEARRIWASCGPIEGTLAAAYLTRRGIFRGGKKGGWPDAIGYHARRKALVAAVTDDRGELVAVQSIALAEPGIKADVETVKRSTGPISRGAVRLPGPDDAPVIFAEGAETALSLWAATGLATWAALGSTANLTPPTDRPVILARDDDARWSPASRKARQTVADWQAQGHRVAVAWPWDIRRGDKSDFNDTLRERGPDAVRERIELARSFLDGTVAPPAERVTLAEARARLDEEVNGFFDGVLDGEGGSLALRVDLGVGKTQAALRHAARTLARMRAAGDDRAIALAVPEHRLGKQVVERFNALAREEGLDLRAAAWRGRNALDPMRDDGEKMCQRLEPVERAQALLLNVKETVCETCPLASSCAYLAQEGQSGDLWVIGHRLVFGTKPKAIPDLAALIIDESPWQAALVGTDGKPLSLPLDALTDESIPVPDGDPVTGDGARLRSLREAMAEALAGHPDGPVRRDALLDVGLDQESGKRGAELEGDRKRKEGDDLEPNRNLRRFTTMWRAVERLLAPTGPALSGHLELTRDEEGIRHITLRGRRPPGDAFRVPTLLLDASLDVELLRPIFGAVAVAEPVLVAQEHVRVRQVTDRAFSKTVLDATATTDPKEAARRRRYLRDVHAHIHALACEPGETLIISNKSIVETLRGLRWPDSVSFAHYNATAGRDDWKDVRRLVVIGRPMPRPESVERMAAALTGRAVQRIEGALPTRDAARRLRNGAIVQAEAVTHPDRIAARILERIVSGEVSQAIGRGRGVSRTDETPLDVHVVGGDVILDEADELVGWERPGPDDLMRAAGGIVFCNPGHAATAYPSLWPSRDAAKKALARFQMGTKPYEDIFIGECPHLRLVRYQRHGARQHPALAYIEPSLDPRAALAALLGPVTLLPLDDAAEFLSPNKIEAVIAPAPAANDDTAPDITLDDGPDDAPDDALDPVAAFARCGGIIPPALRPAARRLQRESGWRQDELARRIGISRPQLANGLQGRFGLSPEPARALVELIAKPPPARAPLLL